MCVMLYGNNNYKTLNFVEEKTLTSLYVAVAVNIPTARQFVIRSIDTDVDPLFHIKTEYVIC